jgi:hypothetical protein
MLRLCCFCHAGACLGKAASSSCATQSPSWVGLWGVCFLLLRLLLQLPCLASHCAIGYGGEEAVILWHWGVMHGWRLPASRPGALQLPAIASLPIKLFSGMSLCEQLLKRWQVLWLRMADICRAN